MNTKHINLSFSPSLVADTPRQFAGIAYSGGVIPNYGELGRVVIDLASLQLPTKPLFALVNHDKNQRAGKLVFTNNGNSVEVLGDFLNTQSGRDVANEFAEGAPWEFSVGILAEVEKFGKPKTIDVNGQTLTVNAVFRNALIREISFVPVGADPNTRAIAFESNLLEIPMPENQNTELSERLENIIELQGQLTSLKEEHSRVVADLNARLVAETAQTKEQFDRANSLEAELSAFKTNMRTNEIKTLFADLQRDFSDEAAQPYLFMGDATFAAVSADLRNLKSSMAPKAEWFKEIAKEGKDTNSPSERELSAKLFNQVAGVK